MADQEEEGLRKRLQRAEDNAADAVPGSSDRELWLKIAQGYRHLLEGYLKRSGQDRDPELVAKETPPGDSGA